MIDLNQLPEDTLSDSPEALREKVRQLEQTVLGLAHQLVSVRQNTIKEILHDPSIPPGAKAGCLGEFSVDTVQVCPECWSRDEDDRDDYCELCNNQSDEQGYSECSVDVPWTTQKEIFKKMCHYKFISMNENK